MPPKPTGKNDRNDRIAFTRSSAERIAKAVRTVEAGARDQAPLVFGGQPAPMTIIRMATFTGSWSKDTARVVTLRGTTATLTAQNVFGIAGSTATGTWDCCVIRDGTAWFCIQGECVT